MSSPWGKKGSLKNDLKAENFAWSSYHYYSYGFYPFPIFFCFIFSRSNLVYYLTSHPGLFLVLSLFCYSRLLDLTSVKENFWSGLGHLRGATVRVWWNRKGTMVITTFYWEYKKKSVVERIKCRHTRLFRYEDKR